MRAIAGEIRINRPVEDVFDTVADERNEPRYNPLMVRVDKVTDGPIGVGTRFRAVHTGRRKPVEMIVELSRFDRPCRLSSVTTMSWGRVRGTLDFRPDHGGTRMGWTWELDANRPIRMVGPLIAAVGRRAERACWEGLKKYLEGDDRV